MSLVVTKPVRPRILRVMASALRPSASDLRQQMEWARAWVAEAGDDVYMRERHAVVADVLETVMLDNPDDDELLRLSAKWEQAEREALNAGKDGLVPGTWHVVLEWIRGYAEPPVYSPED